MLTRCVCMDLPFVQLRAYAQRHSITTLEQLCRTTRAGTGCGTCRPHLRTLLDDGTILVGGVRFPLPEYDGPLTPPLDRAPPSFP